MEDLPGLPGQRAQRTRRTTQPERRNPHLLVRQDPEPGRPSGFRHKNRDDYAVTVCTQDTEFVLLHKLSQEELTKCRQATQRRRSAACPNGPCVCRSLGRKRKVARKVVRSFSDAQVMAQQRAARLLGSTTTFVDAQGEKL